MKCLLIGASCNDTMGRMHLDAQFAGQNSESVTTQWLVVQLLARFNLREILRLGYLFFCCPPTPFRPRNRRFGGWT